MSILRVLVVLMVCVLLPLRGAVAATMPCAQPGPGSELTAALGHVHHGAHGHSHADAASAHADHHHAEVGSASADANAAADDGVHGDSCHLCASGCHAGALLSAAPVTPGAMPAASTVFPALNAPAPDFHSGGQDRPPRTI